MPRSDTVTTPEAPASGLVTAAAVGWPGTLDVVSPTEATP